MMELNKYIEHTLLKQDATKSEVIKLLDEAKEYKFFGVCVNPINVKFAADYLNGSNVKVVTVVGFPLGQNTTESKVLETIDAIKNGADEIDMVLNAGKLRDGEFDFIIEEISKIKSACQGKALKVILETDLLSQEEITVIIKDTLTELSLSSPVKKDKGKIMKVLMPKVKGKADGKLVNQLLDAH